MFDVQPSFVKVRKSVGAVKKRQLTEKAAPNCEVMPGANPAHQVQSV
jgi:hypothetical protein